MCHILHMHCRLFGINERKGLINDNLHDMKWALQTWASLTAVASFQSSRFSAWSYRQPRLWMRFCRYSEKLDSIACSISTAKSTTISNISVLNNVSVVAMQLHINSLIWMGLLIDNCFASVQESHNFGCVCLCLSSVHSKWSIKYFP